MADKMRVLIVDDEPEIGNLLKLFLEDDFDVVTFTDPRQACEEITKNPYSLVVSDIKMPFLTGLDVVKHVKKTRPETHVILITGHAQTERDKAEAKELGAAGVLFKPFGDPGKVVNYLNEVVAGGSILPTAINSAVSAPSVAPATVPSAVTSSGKPMVMVIDDEHDLTDVLSMLLGDYYDLRVFNDPVEALKNINNGTYKLFLTDLNMPQMQGRDVIAKIRAVHPNVPIVVMTGHGENEPMVVEAMKAGGTAVLSKPFPTPEAVITKLGKLIK